MLRIQEVWLYASTVRNRFAKKLAELPWREIEKNREASFYSMKNILLHMIDNEDWIVNWVIAGKSQEYRRKKSAEYTTMGMVMDHLVNVENATKSYFAQLGEDKLKEKVKFPASPGEAFDLTVEECLFQSCTEQLYHIGELIALLWQDNIEPPKMQWFWNNPRTSQRSNPFGITRES